MWKADESVYHFHKSDGKKYSIDEMVNYWVEWANKYPIISIEDGMAEDDWEGWTSLTARLGSTAQIIGDDLFTTNAKPIGSPARR